MAFLAEGPGYTGTIGTLSHYRMRGVDRIVVRRKSGPSREKIQTEPCFERLRENNQEWKACTMAAKLINTCMAPLKILADYNYTGPLAGVCKSIQLDETIHETGKRGVLFSQYAYKLEGFGFNKYNYFDSILRHPLQYTIARSTGTATVQLPAIQPGFNLNNPRKQALYRFVFALGILSDVFFREDKKMFMPVADITGKTEVNTRWYSWQENCEAQQLSLSLNNWKDLEKVSLLLGAGIEFGQPGINNNVISTKYAGAAKLLKLA